MSRCGARGTGGARRLGAIAVVAMLGCSTLAVLAAPTPLSAGPRVAASPADPYDGRYPIPGRGHNDFDGDGADDVFLYGPGSGPDTILWGELGSTRFTVGRVPVNGTFQPVAGDFTGDEATDILWYAAGSAPDYLWRGQVGSRSLGSASGRRDLPGLFAPFVGDFDGDGDDDIFEYGPGSAPDAVLWTDKVANQFTTQRTSVASSSYQPLVVDIDGDTADDIVWYGPGRQDDWIWAGRPGAQGFDTGIALVINGTYRPFGGDIEGDGDGDVFLYAPGAPSDHKLLGQLGTVGYGGASKGSDQVTGTYRPVAGDFDGNGTTDVFWYGPGAAPDAVWKGVPGSETMRPGSPIEVGSTAYAF